MSYSVFNKQDKKNNEKNIFLDGEIDIARYDVLSQPWIDKLYDKQLGFFWQPQEIDVYRDASDFKSLTKQEQHIFTANLKRQILLDSVQGRAPSIAFLPFCSIPELEVWIQAWSFFETIHSRSYSHIIRNVYSNPSIVFDNMLDIQEIVDCAADVSKYYDELIEYGNFYHLLGEGTHTINTGDKTRFVDINKYELKRKIWRALVAVNALEGVRFYVSFICSWAFAEQKKMEGNAKIIKLIARDENLHHAFTVQILKNLMKTDEDFATIAEEEKDNSIELFKQAIEQEKEWAHYLFKEGSMIGLNEKILGEYVDWIAARRMYAIGLPTFTKIGSNPLPWSETWVNSGSVQVAPQETEISSYTSGDVIQDVKEDTFKGFEL